METFLEIRIDARLASAGVAPVAGVHLDGFAFFDEEGDLDGEVGLELGGLLDVAGRIAADALGGFDYL